MSKIEESEPTESNALLQDLVNMSRDNDVKEEQVTQKDKALADKEKQGALVVLDISMRSLKDSQQLFKKSWIVNDTDLFLRRKS